MQNGKTIWAILGALFVAAILSPFWQWYLDHLLDTVTGSGSDVTGAVGRVVHMISPIQQLLFGAVAGMLVAVVIGYWNSFSEAVRKFCFLFWVTPQIAWLSRPTKHPVYVFKGFFEPNQESLAYPIPSEIRVQTLGIENRDQVFFNRLDNDSIHLTRGSKRDLEDGLAFDNCVFGRWLFWKTMRRLLQCRMWAIPASKWTLEQAFEFMRPG